MYPFGKGFNRFIPLLLLLIPMALYIVFYFGPSILTVIYSFTDVKNLPGSTYQFVGLDNYKELFFSGNSGERWRSIINTLIFMFVVTIVQNGVALFIAVIINQRLKGDYFYRAVFFLPVVLGVAVVALIWGMMFDPLNGPVNRLYDALFGYIIFVQIWMYMGYSMLIFLAGLQSVPKDLYEAGHIDGTSKWQSFRHITFP